jgi:hypothetical protein
LFISRPYWMAFPSMSRSPRAALLEHLMQILP